MSVERVFYYFNEISKISRVSGNEKGIADYLEHQGQRMHLHILRDEKNNIILKKQGKACSYPIILQAHMDMVWKAEDENNSSRVPLNIHIENGKMKANGTTLGADDGIGISIMLAILEEESNIYPNLEMVFTTNEEETMEGALALKKEDLTGRYMINLDSEEEGVFTVGSAGGISVIGKLPLPPKRQSQKGTTIEISISGCKGGHSGLEIHKDRENAILLLIRFLRTLEDGMFELVSIEGGSQSNAIPEKALAIVNTDQVEYIREALECFLEKHQFEWIEETNLQIHIKEVVYSLFSYEQLSQENILFFLENMPHGVCKKNKDIICASANMAIVQQNENEIIVEISLRSSYETWLKYETEKIGRFIKQVGGTAENIDGYPAWMSKSGAKLTGIFLKAYQALFGRKAICENVHAGVECGIILKNCPSVQEAISIGPTILYAHTTQEQLDVKSVVKVYELLDYVLKNMG